jgi:hypothetical protein
VLEAGAEQLLRQETLERHDLEALRTLLEAQRVSGRSALAKGTALKAG